LTFTPNLLSGSFGLPLRYLGASSMSFAYNRIFSFYSITSVHFDLLTAVTSKLGRWKPGFRRIAALLVLYWNYFSYKVGIGVSIFPPSLMDSAYEISIIMQIQMINRSMSNLNSKWPVSSNFWQFISVLREFLRRASQLLHCSNICTCLNRHFRALNLI
jgi:hypothetical protein